MAAVILTAEQINAQMQQYAQGELCAAMMEGDAEALLMLSPEQRPRT